MLGALLGRIRPALKLPAMELVQKRLVADVQPACGLLAIPVHFIQGAQDQLAFGFFGGSRGELLEGQTSGGFRRRRRKTKLLARTSYVGKDEVTPDRVLQLTNVAGPMIVAEGRQQLLRQLLHRTLIARVIFFEEIVAQR